MKDRDYNIYEPIVRRELRESFERYEYLYDILIEQMKLYSLSGMIHTLDPVAEKAIALCYTIITGCADYPSVSHGYTMESRTKSIAIVEGVNLSSIGWDERIHSALIGCYEVLRNYITSKRSSSFIEYVENRLPLKYVRTLIKDYKGCRVGSIPYIDDSTTYRPLPKNPREYINMYIKDNVSKFSNEHFPYLGRTNMYRIIRKLDTSTK